MLIASLFGRIDLISPNIKISINLTSLNYTRQKNWLYQTTCNSFCGDCYYELTTDHIQA